MIQTILTFMTFYFCNFLLMTQIDLYLNPLKAAFVVLKQISDPVYAVAVFGCEPG